MASSNGRVMPVAGEDPHIVRTAHAAANKEEDEAVSSVASSISAKHDIIIFVERWLRLTSIDELEGLSVVLWGAGKHLRSLF